MTRREKRENSKNAHRPEFSARPGGSWGGSSEETGVRLLFDARMADAHHLHGIARYFYNILDWGLRHRPGVEIVLATRSRSRWEALQGEHPQLQLVDIQAAPFHWKEHFEWWRLLRARPYQGAFFPSLAAPAWSPVPYWQTIHDLIPWHYPTSPLVRPYLATVGRWCARRARRVVCVSQATAQEVHRLLGVRHSQLMVIANGGLDGGELTSRQASPSPVQGDYFLCVTNPKPHKNLNGLLKAFQGLGERCQLVVCCPACPALEPLPPGVVRVSGLSDEQLRGLYRGARAAIVPSLHEGFGIPALEALQLGAPLLCSNSTSLPEVVGEAAWFFDPRQPSQLRQCLVRALEHPEELARLRELGQQRARLFSWEDSARRHWELFES